MDYLRRSLHESRSGPAAAIGAGVAGIAVSYAFADTRSPCQGHVVRESTVLPLAVAAIVVFATAAPYLVTRNRDVYGVRKPLNRQFGRMSLAAIIALLVVALGLLILAVYASRNCYS